jgi:hypothetical protein
MDCRTVRPPPDRRSENAGDLGRSAKTSSGVSVAHGGASRLDRCWALLIRWTSRRSRRSTRTTRQLEAEIELFDPDIESVPLRAALEDTVQRGHDGIRQLARDIAESWSEAQIEILDFEVRGEQAL